MKKTIWNPTLAWLAAVTAALLLAFVSPNESSLMGSLPMLTAKRLDQQQMILQSCGMAHVCTVLISFRILRQCPHITLRVDVIVKPPIRHGRVGNAYFEDAGMGQ